MFEKAATKETRDILALLGRKKILEESYLAGGTALALQIGRRISYDLDFFTLLNFDRRLIMQKLSSLDFKLERESEGTILGSISGIKFSLFRYKYPLLFKTKNYLGIKIADLRDIAAMKIDAISSRGTKRDFVDLYFLAKKFGLKKLLNFYDRKYKLLQTNKFHLLKSLEYFADAEEDIEPNMLIKDYSWLKIKEYFKEEATKIAKEI
jgi:hypothetical protein